MNGQIKYHENISDKILIQIEYFMPKILNNSNFNSNISRSFTKKIKQCANWMFKTNQFKIEENMNMKIKEFG